MGEYIKKGPLIHNRCARGTTSAGGGEARYRTRQNADATCQRVGHRTTRPTPPIDTRVINDLSRGPSSNAAADTTRRHGGHQRGLLLSDSSTEQNCGTTSAGGGGEGPLTPQRRCHLSTRGPSSNAADTTGRRAEPSTRAPGGTTSAGWGRGTTSAATRLTPPVSAWATLKNIKNRLT